MVDFRKLLQEKRAKLELDRQLAKTKRQSAPTMNTFAGGRKKKEEEPPPPDLSELDIPEEKRKQLKNWISQHASLTKTQSTAKKAKDTLTGLIKPLCKIYGLDRFMSEGNRASYYKTTRSEISEDLLLAAGVTPDIIKKCKITSEIWQLKVTPPGMKDDE